MRPVISLLQENRGISGWRVSETKTDSYEAFFVHRRLETVRSTSTTSTEVTVYSEHDGKVGDSTFTVYGSMTEDDIREKIRAAEHRASLISNEKYSLTDAGAGEYSFDSNMRDMDDRALASGIAEAVFRAETIPGSSVNALEIFIYREKLSVNNSVGTEKIQHKTRVMIEAIPTFTVGKESVELYEDYRFTEFRPEEITREIRSKLEEAKARFEAAKPKGPLKTDVLLRAPEIAGVIWELADDLDYAAKYSHANLHDVGDDLQEGGDGDRLTVTLRGQVKGSDRSAFFDRDGLALRDTCVIKDGTVTANSGSSRFGQYLGVNEPSGILPCIELEPGTLGERETGERDYLECVSMSGIQVELFSDYIGGEIRLGYLCSGGKKTPVTGITMSGSLSAVLKSLRLSENRTVWGSYAGPDRMLIKDMEIL